MSPRTQNYFFARIRTRFLNCSAKRIQYKINESLRPSKPPRTNIRDSGFRVRPTLSRSSRHFSTSHSSNPDTSETIEIPGIATGLAITPVGGDILSQRARPGGRPGGRAEQDELRAGGEDRRGAIRGPFREGEGRARARPDRIESTEAAGNRGLFVHRRSNLDLMSTHMPRGARDFIAAATLFIPPHGVRLIRYFGLYASRSRRCRGQPLLCLRYLP